MIEHQAIKCGMQYAISQTKPSTMYRVKGSYSIEQAKLVIELCDRITDLEKKLAEKPKTKKIIRYVERRDKRC